MPNQTPVDLETALQGLSPALAAKDSVYRLARSGLPDTKERLRALAREGASTSIRRRAALSLSLAVDARPALLELVTVAETAVLPYVLLSLSRVGTVEDLKAIRAAAVRLSSHAAEQARFAELLLAHRLAIGVDVVSPVSTPPASQFPAGSTAITLGSAQEAMRAWSRFVLNASLGFEPDPRRCSLIYCARRILLFIPSIQLANARNLLTDRTIVGATETMARE